MAIGELANDVIAPHHTMDGSPMLTSQAAAVVAAYHYLVGIVEVLSPERRQEVMQNLAAATCNLNPHVVMQMLRAADWARPRRAVGEAGAGVVVAGIIDAMDDDRVAQLLATTLAIEGQASERLAAVFNTIATDDERKARVLTLARRMLSETDFGRQEPSRACGPRWRSCSSPTTRSPSSAASYRAGLDQVGARAEQMASDVPADLVEMLDTLGQDNVRRLSVRLLIDLLTLEKDPARAPSSRATSRRCRKICCWPATTSRRSPSSPRCRARRRTRRPSPARAAGSRSTAWSAPRRLSRPAELLGEMAEAEAAHVRATSARGSAPRRPTR